jgi:pilus assembly protein Flp/PilA
MNQLIHHITSAVQEFSQEEDGAQVIEYALIIAVVSIALVVALKALTKDGAGFSNFIKKVGDCLSTPSTCSA